MATSRSLAFVCNDKRVLTARPASLHEAIAKAAKLFDLNASTVSLAFESRGWWYDVAEDAWDTTAMSLWDPTVLRVVVAISEERRRVPDAAAPPQPEVEAKDGKAALANGIALKAEESPSTNLLHLPMPSKPAHSQPTTATPSPRTAAAPPVATPDLSISTSSSSPSDIIVVKIRGFRKGPADPDGGTFQELTLKCHRSTKIQAIHNITADRLSEEADDIRLLLDGNRLGGRRDTSSLGSHLDFEGPGEVDLDLAREQLG